MKRALLLIITVLTAVMLCACGNSQQQPPAQTTEAAADPIIGTWKIVKYSLWIADESDKVEFEGADLKDAFGDAYYKFNADGTGTITSDSVTQAKWESTAPDTYLMTYTNSETKQETQVMFTITGDTLIGLEGSRKGVGAEYILTKE